MFLTTSKFKFLDAKNYIGPGLSYAWCKSMGCRLQKLMFPYEWLDGYEKLSHVCAVSYKHFYCSLKSTITKDKCENYCTAMGEWLRVYNVPDVVPFIEAFSKIPGQYYLDKIDVCKDSVNIPGTSMTYVLRKFLGKKIKSLSYIHQGLFVTVVEINEKSFSTVIVMVP